MAMIGSQQLAVDKQLTISLQHRHRHTVESKGFALDNIAGVW